MQIQLQLWDWDNFLNPQQKTCRSLSEVMISMVLSGWEHVVADQAVVPREDIRRQITARDMSKMQRTVRIGPGDANKNLLRVHRGLRR